jgi:uncharacterized membrane protein YadS
MNTKTIFFLLLILSASGFISPPIALCAGIIFGLALPHPYAADSRALSKFLLQASVVALGFGMNLHEVLRAGRSGFLYFRGNGDLWRQRNRRHWADRAS